MTRVENTQNDCHKNCEAHFISGIYIIKCGMGMFRHLICRYEYFVYFFVHFYFFLFIFLCTYFV